MSLHCSCDILSRCCMLMSPACTLCVVLSGWRWCHLPVLCVLCCQDGDDVTCLYSVCCVVRMEMMSPACTLCVVLSGWRWCHLPVLCVLCCQDGDDVTCLYSVCCVVRMDMMSPACTLCVVLSGWTWCHLPVLCVLCCQDGHDVTCLYSVCCVVRMDMMSPACTLCVVLCCQDGHDVTCLYSVCCVVRMDMMSPACTLCVVLCCQDGDALESRPSHHWLAQLPRVDWLEAREVRGGGVLPDRGEAEDQTQGGTVLSRHLQYQWNCCLKHWKVEVIATIVQQIIDESWRSLWQYCTINCQLKPTHLPKVVFTNELTHHN